MNLIERWGTGVNRIIHECGEYGLSEPKFEEIGNALPGTMYRKYKINEAVNKYEVVSADVTQDICFFAVISESSYKIVIS